MVYCVVGDDCLSSFSSHLLLLLLWVSCSRTEQSRSNAREGASRREQSRSNTSKSFSESDMFTFWSCSGHTLVWSVIFYRRLLRKLLEWVCCHKLRWESRKDLLTPFCIKFCEEVCRQCSYSLSFFICIAIMEEDGSVFTYALKHVFIYALDIFSEVCRRKEGK